MNNGDEDEDEEDAGEIKQKIDRSLALFFFMCNVPFVAVEKSYFHDFVDSLVNYSRKNENFSYKPPCRKTLSTSLLQKIHAEIQEKKNGTKYKMCPASRWLEKLKNEQ